MEEVQATTDPQLPGYYSLPLPPQGHCTLAVPGYGEAEIDNIDFRCGQDGRADFGIGDAGLKVCATTLSNWTTCGTCSFVGGCLPVKPTRFARAGGHSGRRPGGERL